MFPVVLSDPNVIARRKRTMVVVLSSLGWCLVRTAFVTGVTQQHSYIVAVSAKNRVASLYFAIISGVW